METKCRSKRIYVSWAIALALLLTAGLFCWLVVVPLMGVHSILGEREPRASTDPRSKPVAPPRWPPSGSIDKLGGPEKAAGTLSLYYRLPARLTPRKREAVWLLCGCGAQGESALVSALDDESYDIRKMAAARLAKERCYTDGFRVAAVKTLIELAASRYPSRRASAAYSLGSCADHADLALPALIRLLEDDALLPLMPSSNVLVARDRVRDAARWSLGRIAPGASSAATCFKALLDHESEYVKRTAAQLLKKLQSAEQKKSKS